MEEISTIQITIYDDTNGGQSCSDVFSASNPVNATVYGQNPSELEYLYTITVNQIPPYTENDVPLNPYAQKVVTQLGRMLPTLCGAGAFAYAGKEWDLGVANAFAGTNR